MHFLIDPLCKKSLSVAFCDIQTVSNSMILSQTVRRSLKPCGTLAKPYVTVGFFENKEADAKARGQKLPKKKDPKQEYDNFLQSIAEDVQEVEARQDVEAVEAAQDKADQEAFEHG